MHQKPLHFTDPTEFNIIVKQVQKYLRGSYESIQSHFDQTTQAGTITLTVWNDMAENFAFQEALTISGAAEMILLSDHGDAFQVVNDLYQERHAQPIDPIILNRIYETAVEQYYQSHQMKPIVDRFAAIPTITFPFKKMRELSPVLDQMNTFYFLLSRNASLV